MSWQKKLVEWQQNQLISPDTANAITAYEATRPRQTDMLLRYGVSGLAAFFILLGVALIVAANWDVIPFFVKLTSHVLVNIGVGYYLFGLVRKNDPRLWLREALLLILSGFQLSLIVFVGQHFQINSSTEAFLLHLLLMIGPMVLFLGHGTASALLFFGLLFSYLSKKFDLDYEQSMPVFLLGSGFLYFLGIHSLMQKYRPAWGQLLYPVGAAILILMTVCATEGANAELPEKYMLAHILLMTLLAGTRFVVNGPPYKTALQDILLFGASLALFGYVAAFHTNLGAMILSTLYFVGVVWIAYLHQHARFMVLGIIAVSVRLIIYFVSLNNNMLFNGVIMIAIGLAGLKAMQMLVLKNKENT